MFEKEQGLLWIQLLKNEVKCLTELSEFEAEKRGDYLC